MNSEIDTWDSFCPENVSCRKIPKKRQNKPASKAAKQKNILRKPQSGVSKAEICFKIKKIIKT